MNLQILLINEVNGCDLVAGSDVQGKFFQVKRAYKLSYSPEV